MAAMMPLLFDEMLSVFNNDYQESNNVLNNNVIPNSNNYQKRCVEKNQLNWIKSLGYIGLYVGIGHIVG